MVNGGLAKQEDFGGEDPITPPPQKKKKNLKNMWCGEFLNTN